MADALPLTLLPEGARVRVVELEQVETPATTHLVVLGVLPGAELTLIQRYPAFVLQLGNTQFAVDQELARRVRVRRS